MKIFYKSLLVILWLLVIFIFSNQNGDTSSAITNHLMDNMFWFANTDLVFIIIRKVAHFTEYFILGLLVYNLFREFITSKLIIYSIFACLLCACFDEIHQMFINDRSARIFDIFIDSLGFISSILLINNLSKKRRN